MAFLFLSQLSLLHIVASSFYPNTAHKSFSYIRNLLNING